jgi:predicted RecB family nuclease
MKTETTIAGEGRVGGFPDLVMRSGDQMRLVYRDGHVIGAEVTRHPTGGYAKLLAIFGAKTPGKFYPYVQHTSPTPLPALDTKP